MRSTAIPPWYKPRRRALLQLAAASAAMPLTRSRAAAAPPSRDVAAPPSDANPARFTSKRPPAAERKFTSPAVEDAIATVKRGIADPELAWLFENCFPNTLDTTVRFGQHEGKPDTFVITGDIDAMWLRDSTAQVWPYLPLAPSDPKLRALLEGVIRRQVRCLLIDPYANAFNFDGSKPSHFATDETAMRNEIHERKWELDSLCYPMRLAHGYWRATKDVVPFDAEWRRAMTTAIAVMREQQRKDGTSSYKFRRRARSPSDTLAGGGFGPPARPNGLIVSSFRPSDDATTFPYLIPSNAFAVVALRQLADLATATGATELGTSARALSAEVAAALEAHGQATHPRAGRIWPFEVDGFGNAHFMDDANVPSLLGLPYLGVCAADNPRYLRTRAFVLSDDNPYFARGKAAEGVGGPHVGAGMIWPLSIIMRALTSRNDAEIRACLRTLVRTHADTGFMHESFWKDDPSKFTRPWFAWANTLFGELVYGIARDRPALLRQRMV